ncbi:hypothetical protein YDYSG_04370 [Paenibacillus tyrfis]|nr:hypothetical protein YDYSG_04370 [Paenibacillus tyrfis]
MEEGKTFEDDYEKTLIQVFRILDDYDKNEIIEIMRLKERLRSIKRS